MNALDFAQLGVFFLALIALTPLLGKYMAAVFEGRRTVLTPIFGPLETLTYRLSGINVKREMNWLHYFGAVIAFNLIGALLTLVQMLTQQWLPLNPQHLPNVPFPLALNTAISFMTNTNWQAYSGEATMSYLTQMTGLAVHNFTSAATGIAVLLTLVRGLVRKQTDALGNFWTDLTRTTLYVLLPLSIIFAFVLVHQGVPQTLAPYAQAHTLEDTAQTIPLGPVASQIAIKQLGTNGGGFFGQNSAHPFENPTPLSNFLELLAILLLPSALVYTFGCLVGDKRQAWAIWAAMLVLFLAGFATSYFAELQMNPVTHLAGSMEGKETRFGVMNSVLWSTATTATSNGSVNAMHDSLSPLAGMVALLNMHLGEVIFGGIGCGLYGMLMFVFLTVFIAGLMVGRTPEYLGKKIEAREICWAIVAILVPCALILLGSATGVATNAGLSSLANQGPHGLGEILYAFTSATANNGSAFAGLSANTGFYNYALAACMLLGRFLIILPVLAIAGSMVQKKISPTSAGTFPTNGATFTTLLTGVILIVAGLTFFPVLALGPVVEHFLMLAGRTF